MKLFKFQKSDKEKPAILRQWAGSIVIIINVVLLACIFLFYVLYTAAYEERLKEENLGNIANLNRSAATNATSLFDSWNIKLDDLAKYISVKELTVEGALDVLNETNSSDDRYFEVIGTDSTGYLARKNDDGQYPRLDYTSYSYDKLQKIFAGAGGDKLGMNGFTPEYTDGSLALRFFATYKTISLKDENGDDGFYTLMLAARSSNVLAQLNWQNDYVGQSTVIIDSRGNYIVNNQDFKSANFFQYLYIYNDLTLDHNNAFMEQMGQQGSGQIYFKNTVGEDCVFRFDAMSENDWYCVTCVPLASFRAPIFKVNYVIYALITLLILFAVDVFWLRSVNKRLRVSVLREQQASAAKGNFMSRMSHEIRTPLNAVIGYNTIAQSEMKDARSEEERKQAEMKVLDCLTKSDIASKHLLTIINDVLDMSAIESGKIQAAHDKFDFKGLITSLTTVFYSQARAKGVEFEVIFDTLTEEWFVGDQMRTSQILTNLLSNAVKFTSEGGSVKLIIHQPEADTNASHIHFQVTDTGIGMTKEYLTHIWTPFEQADSSISRRFGGTGLGLSITKNLVDLMGGTITVDSTPGIGSDFNVDLTFGRTEQPKRTETYDFTDVNALVVDDDINTCDYIRLLFNRCGAGCATFTSGSDAVAAFAEAVSKGRPYTVCLIDWRMPNMDGIETVKRIKKIAKNEIPLIVLSAYDYTELADKAAEVGVTKFISKPLFQSTLFDLLANISGAGSRGAMSKSQTYDFTGSRVLLAEDNAMNMEIARKIMESAGLAVDSAWNGREAVEMFEASPAGTYKAILMDVHMPEMTGHEAARAIRASAHGEAKTIPIIAMTADAFAENVAEALEAGMNGHIAKPIDVYTLFETLKKFIK